MNEEIKNIENEEVDIPVSKTEETVESFREAHMVKQLLSQTASLNTLS